MMSNKAKGLSSAIHIEKSINLGGLSERRFYDSCKNANLSIKKSKKTQNINHVDFFVDGISFDVKGIKNSQKNGNILIELKNVRGKNGWCSETGPEIIAFDFGAFFLNVKNSDLLKLVAKKCNLEDKVPKCDLCLYKGYTRREREDLMTMLTLKDVLVGCEHSFLPVEEYREPMDLL